MVAVTTLPWSGPFTRADLELMPDDGHRYEIIDGILLVTPSPGFAHQRAVTRLWRVLADAAPDGIEVLVAPFDVVLADDTVVVPDVLLARRDDFTSRDLPGPPMLAVEVLSPSTRSIDLHLKRSRLEKSRVASYWVIDPLERSLIAWDLQDGTYAEIARVTGDQPFEAVQPFPVTIVASRLVDD